MLLLSTDLKFNPVAVLRVKLWFSGFDTTGFYVFYFYTFAHFSRFFPALSHYHNIILFCFVLNCRFYFVFLVDWKLLNNDCSHWFLGGTDELIS